MRAYSALYPTLHLDYCHPWERPDPKYSPFSTQPICHISDPTKSNYEPKVLASPSDVGWCVWYLGIFWEGPVKPLTNRATWLWGWPKEYILRCRENRTQKVPKYISVISQSYISRISVVYQSYISHTSVIYQSYIIHISVIHQYYISHDQLT